MMSDGSFRIDQAASALAIDDAGVVWAIFNNSASLSAVAMRVIARTFANVKCPRSNATAVASRPLRARPTRIHSRAVAAQTSRRSAIQCAADGEASATQTGPSENNTDSVTDKLM